MITSTTQTLEGMKITEYLGVITEEHDKMFAPKYVFNHLVEQAKKLGANALVGISFTACTRGTNGAILVYGTAVKVEPMNAN